MRIGFSCWCVLCILFWCLSAQAQATKTEETLHEDTSKLLLAYSPLFFYDVGGVDISLPLSISERIGGVSGFPVSTDGTRYSQDPTWNTQVRVGAHVNTHRVLKYARVLLDYEHDIVTGVHNGGADEDLGVFVPDVKNTDNQLRTLSAQIDLGPLVHVIGGLRSQTLGMGLLANGGDITWQPRSADFVDPRGGDRAWGGLLVLGPFENNHLLFAAGVQKVAQDDVIQGDDEAQQAIASVTFAPEPTKRASVSFASRKQEAPDGDVTSVGILDIYGQYERKLRSGVRITAEAELAWVEGETDLAPSIDYARHDVRQLGFAASLGVHWPKAGGVFDVVYASGDNNLDDEKQTAFRADRNFPLGLILHSHVLAAQTARGPVSASNPDLVGRPAEDLDRFPTRGSLSNTLAFFPRGYYQPLPGLEVYGGPLLALADKDLVDPYETRISGGSPRNALGGGGGHFLGTEVDLGIRYRMYLMTSEWNIGVEGGAFFPGAAFENAEGETLDTITAARAMVQVRL